MNKNPDTSGPGHKIPLQQKPDDVEGYTWFLINNIWVSVENID
jgi:hypothetical protein